MKYERKNNYVTEIESGRRVVSMVSELNRLAMYIDMRDLKIIDLEKELGELRERFRVLKEMRR